jgi:hypothetical protein
VDLLTILRSQWDRVAAVVCVAAGIVALILGYHGVAGSPYVAEELAYLISGGLGGVFLLGVGATLYVSADMHDEWRKLDRIEAAILSLADGQSPPLEEEVRRRTSDRSAPSFTDNRVPAGAALRVAAGGGAVLPREMLRSLRITVPATFLALSCLVAAYLRAATVSRPGPAFTATSIAVIGLLLCGLGAAAGPLRMRRQLRVRRIALLGGFLDQAQSRTVAAPPVPASAQGLVGIPGGRYAHLPSCAMVAGTQIVAFGPGALPSGVEPCELCTDTDR